MLCSADCICSVSLADKNPNQKQDIVENLNAVLSTALLASLLCWLQNAFPESSSLWGMRRRKVVSGLTQAQQVQWNSAVPNTSLKKSQYPFVFHVAIVNYYCFDLQENLPLWIEQRCVQTCFRANHYRTADICTTSREMCRKAC